MRRLTLGALAGLALLLPAGPAPAQPISGDIGLRLLVQPWNPATDDETVHRIEHPQRVSNALAAAWHARKGEVSTRIKGFFERREVAPGFTLSNIDLRLPDPQATVQRISRPDSQPLLLRLDLRFAGAVLVATFDSLVDPRCSARLDLTLSLALTVTPGSTPLLAANRLAGEPAMRLHGFGWDAENVPCEALKAAAIGFGFEALVQQSVAQGLPGDAVVDVLIAELGQSLAAADGLVANAVPAGLARRVAWFVDRPGAQLLALHFGPAAPLPDPARPATVRGTLRILPPQGVVGAGATPEVDCTTLPIAAERKAGPRPVINAFGALGDAPMEELRLTTSCTRGPNDTVEHSISGLSSAFPTMLRSTGLSHGCRPGQTWKSGLVLTLPGRNNQRILPSELSARFDIDVAPLSSPCALQFIEERDPRRREPLDRDTAWRRFEEITQGRMILDRSMGEVLARFGGVEIGMDQLSGGTAIGGFADGGGLVSLNPQPLPPEPPDRLRVLEDLVRVQQEQIQLQQRQFRLQQELMRVR